MRHIYHGIPFRRSSSWLTRTHWVSRPRFALHSPHFSSTSKPSEPVQVSVPVGGNGSITLDIHHPLSSSTATPVIIYLPRGPIIQKDLPEPPSLTPLALSANTTVVRLNYRLSKEYKYPAPVHDVLAGYDWVVNNLARGPPERSGLRRGPGNIGVCGELLGGSLAAALAMTECDPGTTGIRAAVLGNPITDWTAMYPVQKADVSGSLKVGAKRAKRPNSWTAAVSDPILSTRELLKARNTYFRIPEDYFDTFASPLLFFRTPCDDVPAPADPIDEIFASMGSSLREFNKKRRSNRRHPPLASKLDLPQTRIWVGEKNALKDQGIELAEAVARSITLYSGREKVEDGSGWDRVEVQLKEGLGFWGEAELMHMGSWFSEVLR